LSIHAVIPEVTSVMLYNARVAALAAAPQYFAVVVNGSKGPIVRGVVGICMLSVFSHCLGNAAVLLARSIDGLFYIGSII
jgi:hypothetical protein